MEDNVVPLNFDALPLYALERYKNSAHPHVYRAGYMEASKNNRPINPYKRRDAYALWNAYLNGVLDCRADAARAHNAVVAEQEAVSSIQTLMAMPEQERWELLLSLFPIFASALKDQS